MRYQQLTRTLRCSYWLRQTSLRRILKTTSRSPMLPSRQRTARRKQRAMRRGRRRRRQRQPITQSGPFCRPDGVLPAFHHPPHDGISKAIAEFAVQCGLPVYVTIDTVLHIIATIWCDEHLRAQTAMSFVPLNYQSVAAASFTLVLGSMRYSGLLHQMAVQHEPGDPDVKPLDVQSFPVVWPANLPASLNMKVYSVLGMGIIMLASNPLQ